MSLSRSTERRATRGNVEIRSRHVKPQRAIDFVEWQDRAVDNLTQATVDILSNKAVLRRLRPLHLAHGMIGSEFDEAAIGFNGTVAVAWMAERRLLAGYDTPASSDANVLRRAMRFDDCLSLLLLQRRRGRRSDLVSSGTEELGVGSDLTKYGAFAGCVLS